MGLKREREKDSSDPCVPLWDKDSPYPCVPLWDEDSPHPCVPLWDEDSSYPCMPAARARPGREHRGGVGAGGAVGRGGGICKVMSRRGKVMGTGATSAARRLLPVPGVPVSSTFGRARPTRARPAPACSAPTPAPESVLGALFASRTCAIASSRSSSALRARPRHPAPRQRKGGGNSGGGARGGEWCCGGTKRPAYKAPCVQRRGGVEIAGAAAGGAGRAGARPVVDGRARGVVCDCVAEDLVEVRPERPRARVQPLRARRSDPQFLDTLI